MSLQYVKIKLWKSQSSDLYLFAQVASCFSVVLTLNGFVNSHRCGHISSLTSCSWIRLSFLGMILPAPEICTPGDRKIKMT